MLGRSQQQPKGFTLVELLALLGVLTVLIALALPAQAKVRQNSRILVCMNNLKQQWLAFNGWAAAHGDKYSMGVTAPNGGPAAATSTPLNTMNNPTYMYQVYQCMSNELRTPKLLVCPSDEKNLATNFLQLNANGNAYVSYGIALFASVSNPRMILASDRNIYGPFTPSFSNSGYGNGLIPGTPGGAQIALTTNSAILNNVGYTPNRMHQGTGNLLTCDGSARQLNSAQLRSILATTGDQNSSSQNFMWFP